MAFPNLTGDPRKKSFEELECLTEFTSAIHIHLIILSALHGFMAITALLGNILILAALHKASSIHLPSKLLFRSLATNDLCVDVIVEPLFATYFISALKELKERWNICRFALAISRITGYIVGSVSSFTGAISVYRLLALVLGLRYRQVVLSNFNCFLGCIHCRIVYVLLE